MRIRFGSGLGLLVACSVLAGNASSRILVQVPAVLEQSARIDSQVRSECGVGQLIGNNVFQQVKEKIPGAEQLADSVQAGADPFLKLTITDVLGIGGEMGGPKLITFRAELLVNGHVTATKIFKRDEKGGLFENMLKPCSIIERDAIILGTDVAKWLPDAISAIPATVLNAPAIVAPPDVTSVRSQVNQHRKQIPLATTFSAIDNVAAVPVREAGRSLYLQYLAMPAPKAFVVYSTGMAKAYGNDVDAMTKALDNCSNEGKACWLYAVDDRIVWSADEGRRIGLSARLRNK